MDNKLNTKLDRSDITAMKKQIVKEVTPDLVDTVVKKVKEDNHVDIPVIKTQQKTNEAEMKQLSSRVDNYRQDVSKLSDRLELLHSEPQEIEKRKKNLIIRGLPEMQAFSDEELTKTVLDTIEVNSVTIQIKRLGKPDSDRVNPRPVRLIMPDVESKAKALSNATKLRRAQSEENPVNLGKVFV